MYSTHVHIAEHYNEVYGNLQEPRVTQANAETEQQSSIV